MSLLYLVTDLTQSHALRKGRVNTTVHKCMHCLREKNVGVARKERMCLREIHNGNWWYQFFLFLCAILLMQKHYSCTLSISYCPNSDLNLTECIKNYSVVKTQTIVPHARRISVKDNHIRVVQVYL